MDNRFKKRKMKRIFLVMALVFGVFCVKAQTIDFLGVEVCGADTTAFCTILKDKGYTYFGTNEKSIMYVGKFAGVDASVMVVPFDGSDKVNAVVFSMDNLNPVKMGNLYAELLQKFMRKYENLKYDTHTDATGSVTTSFRNNTGFVALKTDISDIGRTCGISVYYSCNIENATTNSGSGIGLDDI